MMKRLCLWGLLLVIALPAPGLSRMVLDINAPTLVQIPIVVPKWKAQERTPTSYTSTVYEILTNDLSLSGFFRVINDRQLPSSLQQREGIPRFQLPNDYKEWMPAGGDFLLAGEARLDPVSLQVRLTCHLFDLVENKHLVGKQYEGHSQSLRNMVHRIADEVILQLTGEKGVHTTKIAYTLSQGEGKEIFIADFDGANVRQVTQNQSINISPVWTPDGRRIAFTSYLKRNPDLYLIDPDGKNLQRLSFQPGLNLSPSWSPDGKQIALMMGIEGKSEICVIDPGGGNLKKLTRGYGNEASPSWSPDGKSIAFVSDRSGSPQIYIMSADGSDVRRLTYEGSYNTNPSWSPRGDRIAYCGRAGGRYEIFTIQPDGSELRKVTSGVGSHESPQWSPDGRYIVFSSNRTGGSKIFVMNANGFNPRPLTSSKGGEGSPSCSRRFE
jgi:TolB protein